MTLTNEPTKSAMDVLEEVVANSESKDWADNAIVAMQIYSSLQNKRSLDYISSLRSKIEHLEVLLQEAKTSAGRGWKAYERTRKQYEELLQKSK